VKITSSIIENKYIKVKTLNIGASIFEIIYKPKKLNLILNLGSKNNYKIKNPHVGATCGRYANRISNAKFKIKGKIYKISKNENNNCLHGGKIGFNKKIWKIDSHSKKSIIYKIISKNLDQGFPGNLNLSCKYELKNKTLSIFYNFFSDKITHVNITNHCYWNLNKNKKKNIFNHDLKIISDYYLPVNKFNIPTGKKNNVEKSYFNFNRFSNIGKKLLLKKNGFDINYITKKRKDNLTAILANKNSGISLGFYSNQPGLQFYTGHKLKFKNLLYPYQGLCLENQHFPNTPNEKKFPSTLILPYKKYKYFTKIKLIDLS
tara:strand:+ start:84 stop:1037 length:954 start_codon:yes stop_codon:yes gene_type:complete